MPIHNSQFSNINLSSMNFSSSLSQSQAANLCELSGIRPCTFSGCTAIKLLESASESSNFRPTLHLHGIQKVDQVDPTISAFLNILSTKTKSMTDLEFAIKLLEQRWDYTSSLQAQISAGQLLKNITNPNVCSIKNNNLHDNGKFDKLHYLAPNDFYSNAASINNGNGKLHKFCSKLKGYFKPQHVSINNSANGYQLSGDYSYGKSDRSLEGSHNMNQYVMSPDPSNSSFVDHQQSKNTDHDRPVYNHDRDAVHSTNIRTHIPFSPRAEFQPINEGVLNHRWSQLTQATGFNLSKASQVQFSHPDAACFSEPCPTETYALNNIQTGAEFHANNVTVTKPNGGQVNIIASQQPKNSDRAVALFFKFLKSKSVNRILDLRSYSDFKYSESPRYRYSSNIKDINVSTFRDWPDQGVISSDALRALKNDLNNFMKDDENILVHCRAGVGRTGTVLSYTSLYNTFSQNKPNNREDALTQIDNTILKMRQQRGPKFVQTNKQYGLVVNTLLQDFNL